MKKFLVMFCMTVLVFGAVGVLDAGASVVNFDSFSSGQNIHGLDLGDVTITGTDGMVEVFAGGVEGTGCSSPYNCIAASSWSAGRYLTLTFDSLVSNVSIVGGDKGSDLDRFSMEAFDSGMTSLGLVDTGVFGGSVLSPDHYFGDYRTQLLPYSNIKYVILTQIMWGCAWDDLKYDIDGPPIPEPASMLLLGTGLLGLVGFGKRKLKKS